MGRPRDAEVVFAKRFSSSPQDREILRADLESARWCLDGRDQAPASRSDFLKMHQRFASHITGRRIRLLAELPPEQLPPERLSAVIHGWARLYRAAIGELAERRPAAQGDELVMDGRCWTEELGINLLGLAHLAAASRYAEYWAERSLTDDSFYGSLESRLDFVGSGAYQDLSLIHISEPTRPY